MLDDGRWALLDRPASFHLAPLEVFILDRQGQCSGQFFLGLEYQLGRLGELGVADKELLGVEQPLEQEERIFSHFPTQSVSIIYPWSFRQKQITTHRPPRRGQPSATQSHVGATEYQMPMVMPGRSRTDLVVMSMSALFTRRRLMVPGVTM